MKKIWKYFVMLFIANLVKQSVCVAQIIYEHTYSIQAGQETPFLTNIGNNDYKYVLYNWYEDKFSLYNIDHTPFILNIPLPISSDSGQAYQIGYITNSLFDCDSTNLEYAIMAQSPRDSLNFYVYRTDGTLLFSKDSVTVPFGYGANAGTVEIHGITNTNAGAKLELFNQNLEYFIYGLCGTLPQTVSKINISGDYLRVFPSPSSGRINFSVMAPSNIEDYNLIIFDSNFQTIKSIVISAGQQKEIVLENDLLATGTYFYSLQNKKQIFQSGKFMITK